MTAKVMGDGGNTFEPIFTFFLVRSFWLC